MRRVEYKTPNGNVIKVAFQYEVGDEIEVYIEKEDYEGKAEVLDVVVPTIKVGETVYSGKFLADGSGPSGKYIWDYEKGVGIDLPSDTWYRSLSWKRYTTVDGKTRFETGEKYYLSSELAERDYEAILATEEYYEEVVKGIFGFDKKTLRKCVEGEDTALGIKVSVEEKFELR